MSPDASNSGRPTGVGHGQRGAVIIWVAFFMVTILGFVALGVDVAKLMATRTQLQTAADASALSGASAVDPQTGVLTQNTAVARAQETASKNHAFRDVPLPVSLLSSDVKFPAATTVQVKVRRDPSSGGAMVTHVAQVLGLKGLAVTAKATALAEKTGTVDCGLVPLFVDLTGQPPLQTGCGNTYTLKVGGGAGSNGNYGAVDFKSCYNGECPGVGPTGSSAFQCLLTNGYCCSVSVGEVLDTEPGNMSGATRKAVDARFYEDTDSRLGICYQSYRGNGRRVITVPLTTAPTKGGKATVTVTGFAMFFLKDKVGNGNQSTLTGEFLYGVVPGSGGGKTGTAVSLRLVQ